MAELAEQGGQRGGVVVLQAEAVAKRLAVFTQQLTDSEA